MTAKRPINGRTAAVCIVAAAGTVAQGDDPDPQVAGPVFNRVAGMDFAPLEDARK